MSGTELEILQAAISGIKGTVRDGQQAMASSISQAMDDQVHLLVQAGTGTGKSLGYLAPILARLADSSDRIVVATATLALQTQLATKDIPAALAATQQATGDTPKTAILKGRTNYACLYRTRQDAQAAQAALIGAEAWEQDSTTSEVGRQVLALREWVERELDDGGLADRDQAPVHSAQAWSQVSIPTRECLGADACPFGPQCFVEAARHEARSAQLIVTNHALLAIDAMHGGNALPEHEFLIIDEAHELASRITAAASVELSPGMIERTAKRALTWLDDDLGVDFLNLADTLKEALDSSTEQRITQTTAQVPLAAASIRDVSRQVLSVLNRVKDDAHCTQAAAAVKEIFEVSERVAALSDSDVVWVRAYQGIPHAVIVAPLSVAGLLRTQVFGAHPTIATSATLELGGSFEPFARNVGLRVDDQVEANAPPRDEFSWRCLDVGSPFNYPKQGILYTASHLPPPGREGLSGEALEEIAQLMWAADGRTLGLFSSWRAAEQAASYCRTELPSMTILCQGDAHLPELQRRFIDEEQTSLFGTLSLWQGVDVPGATCQLVIIDKIPFPRPDDPLMQARQRAIDEAGGNGFMSVAATHAAQLLAQGTGRLIRRSTDRGVVAILDPRLETQRYGKFLRASIPQLWRTSSRDVVVEALRRLRAA